MACEEQSAVWWQPLEQQQQQQLAKNARGHEPCAWLCAHHEQKRALARFLPACLINQNPHHVRGSVSGPKAVKLQKTCQVHRQGPTTLHAPFSQSYSTVILGPAAASPLPAARCCCCCCSASHMRPAMLTYSAAKLPRGSLTVMGSPASDFSWMATSRGTCRERRGGSKGEGGAGHNAAFFRATLPGWVDATH